VWSFIFFQGVLGTLRAALTAAVFALILGVIFSLLRSSEITWIRVPTAVVLEFLRGMPVLLMMLFILLVMSTDPFWAVVAALSLYNGALIGEALRAGLASLPRGQREAGLSLGMRPLQSKMLVEFPQAFRQMLPIIVAQLVVLLKDTSLGYIVGYTELLRVTMNNLSSFYGNRYLFTFFVITLVLYLAMNLSLSWFARWLSKRTASKSSGKRLDPTDPGQALLVAEASAASRRAP
jgi:glutamate transport system permease protein